MNRDFVEMLSALSDAGVEYLVVGAHAMAVHGRPRATGDLDIWAVLGLGELVRNKKAVGRPRDLADAAELESAGRAP